MLEEVRGRGAHGLLIMTDSAFHSGLRLLYSFIMAALQSLTFHDGFSDPLHWETSVPSLTLQHFSAQGVLERVGCPRGPLTVVFHSLSWILLRCPLPYVCHQLRELSGLQSEHGDTCVVALLHADLHEPGVLRSVCLLADTVIALSDQGEKASVLQRRRSGKVVTCMETFRVHDDFSLETILETDEEPENSAPVDPTVNLTFNLRLSGTERERKESATLPYTFTDSKKMCLLGASSGSAKIFYDAEPADDVDEEDPDDDLDV
ncbi:elongator complex protein 5 isoform X2 [Bufo bufo]|uniref:elongator complex protein 5 isoform X2 n=1 Tax=Bufo bufo TaxID=8384 RepID=UPI001ABDF994|nr:elongator complex protein 5 isoform X2 [Bufo bufo]